MADLRVTQIVAEVIESDNPELCVTQAAAEVLESGNPDLSVTQAAVEVLESGNPDLVVTQSAIEVLESGDPFLNTSQFVLEVITPGFPQVRMDAVLVKTEILKTVTVSAIVAVTTALPVTASAVVFKEGVTKTVTVDAQVCIPELRATQVVEEVLVGTPRNGGITQLVEEVLAQTPKKGLITQSVFEVLIRATYGFSFAQIVYAGRGKGSPYVYPTYDGSDAGTDPGDTDPLPGLQVVVSPTGGDDTLTIRNALASIPTSGGALLFADGNYIISDDIEILNYSNLVVTSQSADRTKVTLNMTGSGSGRDYYCFRPAGTINTLTIKHLTINGVGQRTGRQCGIGNPSGVVASNVTYRNLAVRNVNVGLSFNADLSGSYNNCVATYCSLQNLRGTLSGSGYGIHFSKAENVSVTNNVIDNAERHAIYCAKTKMASIQNIEVTDNAVTNHRKDVADGSLRCAIVVSRSRNVEVARNTITDGFDGALEVSHETATGNTCYNISVHDNRYSRRRNAVPYVMVGEQGDGTGYTVHDVSFVDETFDSDERLYGSAPATVFWLLNGLNVSVTSCDFLHTGAGNGVTRSMTLGDFRYSPSTVNSNNVTAIGNTFSYQYDTAGHREVTLDGALRYSPPATVTLDVTPYIEP